MGFNSGFKGLTAEQKTTIYNVHNEHTFENGRL